jgi:hypothetical protein
MGTEDIHFDDSRRQSQERPPSGGRFVGARSRRALARDKRRAAVVAIGLAIVFGLAGPAGAAKSKKHTFTENVIAASITADGSESVAKITDSVDGPGAGTSRSVSTSTSYPFKGTDTNISYFANGVQRSTDTFTIEKPDANGISKFTAKGKCTGGTRTHKSLKCTFTESGTVDTNPGGVAKIKVIGSYSR